MEAPSDIRRTALRQDVKPWLGAALKHARQTPGMARMVSEWVRAIAALFVRLPQEKAGDKRVQPRSRLLFMRFCLNLDALRLCDASRRVDNQGRGASAEA